MLKKKIITLLRQTLKDLDISLDDISVDYPASAQHGDYSTNVALAAAKKAGKNPMELAEKIVENLGVKNKELQLFNEIHVAKPGFINFWIASDSLLDSLNYSFKHDNEVKDKKIMVEFAHPNTHKAFHIGHLRNITTGESIVRLLEVVGAKVIRANYQGDVGMHIAKCLYGILQNPTHKTQILKITDVKERVDFLGKAYASGSKSFEEDDKAKKEIAEINKKIYAKDSSIWELYQTTRQWSLDYFDEIYKRVYTHFDKYYFESMVYESGKKNVLIGLEKSVFKKSDGAIIFPGSKYGLHDRVFITSEGNPTYEGKDMGLAPLQFKDYHPDLIIHLVGPEQAGYFQVVFEALAQLFPEIKGKERHQSYGFVNLKHGKMSSRTGNVILGEWLLDEAKKKILESYDISDEIAEQVAVGAVKYSFLKVGLNQEIAFDLEESISLQGNSGPYLQYAYARTQSILRKGKEESIKGKENLNLKSEERDVLRLLSRFPEIVEEAATRYAPNVLCTYLFELAQAYNLFYQKFPILKAEDDAKNFRLLLTIKTGNVLKDGLELLGIKAPQQM